ncbi:hypothetical protein [Deinococcus koreensis]|uniref:BioF2-like acetyltransferase domain-containing protein n=1 Tax=Deinococcus koreensis TaxID=2054903 RepID=A0A2K3UZA8_9DEIO|nr:hypothetical protein [Deinococcus koreensis]PNY81869.1 hypothetical protein CVO96_11225 [Deinococcus koreensis]
MIHTRKTSALVPYSVVWFPEARDVAEVANLRSPLTMIRQGSPEFMERYGHRVVHRRSFCTAVADLTLSEDQLMARLSRTCRYGVRQALKTEHEFSVALPSELPQARRLIDEFNIEKFGHPVSEANWALTERSGCISQITVEGQVVSANTHLIDGIRRARALYGATAARSGGAFNPRLISELNRALIWFDMLYFRSLGIRLYDAGGLFDDPQHPSRGIDEFKLSFGMDRRYEYHALTSPYVLARQGMRLLGKGA